MAAKGFTSYLRQLQEGSYHVGILHKPYIPYISLIYPVYNSPWTLHTPYILMIQTSLIGNSSPVVGPNLTIENRE